MFTSMDGFLSPIIEHAVEGRRRRARVYELPDLVALFGSKNELSPSRACQLLLYDHNI